MDNMAQNTNITIISKETFPQERALYGARHVELRECRFEGVEDGESALKECEDVTVYDTFFDLRYPLWHVKGVRIVGSEMTSNCRASLWYSEDVKIENSRLHGIKAVRECERVDITGTDIVSPEWGWRSRGVKMKDSTIDSVYCLLMARDVQFDNVKMSGKYSFQYVENATFRNCEFDTKDAWWHAKNVTVEDSVVKGEYLGWYSDGLTLINCTIIGTQPLCYCKNLTLQSCRMIDTDLSFERSEVNAEIEGEVLSIKNPYLGKIVADGVGEIIIDDDMARADIVVKNK